MIDVARVREKLAYVRHAVAEMERLRAIRPAPTSTDLLAARYLLHTSVEAMIDIANHLIARMKLPVPHTYADSFERLIEAGIIDAGRRQEWRSLAQLRNRIVHLYDAVTDAEVRSVLETDLGRWHAFIAAIERRLEAEEQAAEEAEGTEA